MAFHFLIDGYNLLYALPELPPGTWQVKREQLLKFLQERRPYGNNRATVVFDSRQGLGDQMTVGELSVIFTAGETADDRIGAMVREASNPRTLQVISNDLGIRELVRGTGARFMTCDEFLKNAASTPQQPAKPDNSAEKNDITEEFRKKWL